MAQPSKKQKLELTSTYDPLIWLCEQDFGEDDGRLFNTIFAAVPEVSRPGSNFRSDLHGAIKLAAKSWDDGTIGKTFIHFRPVNNSMIKVLSTAMIPHDFLLHLRETAATYIAAYQVSWHDAVIKYEPVCRYGASVLLTKSDRIELVKTTTLIGFGQTESGRIRDVRDWSASKLKLLVNVCGFDFRFIACGFEGVWKDWDPSQLKDDPGHPVEERAHYHRLKPYL